MTSEDDLDDLLARAAEVPTTTEAVAEIGRMARGVRRSRRRPWVVLGVVGALAAGGVVAFGGGITPLTVDLTNPPFQELPDGWLRTHAWVPIEWTQVDGHEERCRTYLELVRGDTAMIDALDAAIAAHDWSGLGQRLYDALPPGIPANEVESEVTLAAVPIIEEFAIDVVPELAADPDGPGIGALATTCRTDL